MQIGEYLQTVKTLEKRYGKERVMRRIPVVLSNGERFRGPYED